MLSAKFILAAFSSFVAVSAAPGAEALGLRSEQASTTITVCTGTIIPAQGCATIPIVSDSCLNLKGGLSFLNKAISTAEVPTGFVCIFFEDFDCHSSGVKTHDVAVLTEGTWNMFHVQGAAGTQNFNDLTSSINCSPI
ncbi:hypothetical protein C8J56DRAFT_1025910 [Mycena floridula]|nr:hypothetical protein C8J56DRAFT_1025910 [Mycena floridula]